MDHQTVFNIQGNASKLPMPEVELAEACLLLGIMRPEVHLANGGLESILKTKELSRAHLEFYTRRLMSAIEFEIAPNGMRMVAPFESVACTLDPNGKWTATFKLSPTARQFLETEEGLDLLHQKICSALCERSHCSQVLWEFLEEQKDRRLFDFDVGISFLRTLLGSHVRSFRKLNEDVLKPCHLELTLKEACFFDYMPIKHHSQIDAVHFHIEAEKS